MDDVPHQPLSLLLHMETVFTLLNIKYEPFLNISRLHPMDFEISILHTFRVALI